MNADKILPTVLDQAIVFFKSGDTDYIYHALPDGKAGLTPVAPLSKKHLAELVGSVGKREATDMFGYPDWSHPYLLYKDRNSVIWHTNNEYWVDYEIETRREGLTTRDWPSMVWRFNVSSKSMYVGHIQYNIDDIGKSPVIPLNLGANAKGWHVHSCGMGLDQFGVNDWMKIMDRFMDTTFHDLPDNLGPDGMYVRERLRCPIETTLDAWYKHTSGLHCED
jgi:hypothetical protein